ncbi:MAG TPA: MBL fold metallo-hydrolase [Dongiaceae bacterium]|nr:MBL fold metallo-hydrolase [Dongiaceae bacterium]
MPLTLQFLGAAGTVTGSRHLLSLDSTRLLVDCGLFQGLKQLRLKNWAPFPVPPASIDGVVLTHAHLDHTGYLPALVRDGFRGQAHCSGSTADLCRILLPDSGHLQEQDAAFANSHGFSKHKPALPLYGVADAERTLEHLSTLPFEQEKTLPAGVRLRLSRAGHILGASIVELGWGSKRIVFSGDLGRYDDPILPDPAAIEAADYVVVESTYGDRAHEAVDAQALLGDIIERTAARGGTVVIPAFAVGRGQTLLFHIERLKAKGRLKSLRVYLDSPMAIDASDLPCGHLGDHKLTPDQSRALCAVAHYVRSGEESKALTADPTPKIIISASGMATGGRILHHLKRYAPDPRNTILFAGYQAAGTRGQAMVSGAKSIKIHGGYVPVRAEIGNLSMLSAHADAGEILRWLKGFRQPPRMIFIVHGEPTAADGLRRRIQDELGWPAKVAEQLETVELA